MLILKDLSEDQKVDLSPIIDKRSKMPTLDRWIVKKDNDGEKIEPLFTIFFLDGETMKATWVREMPKFHTYSTTIKWSALSDEPVTIVGNIGRADTDKFPHFVFPSEAIYNNVPYLKSHLQKCIRRSNLNLTLKTALHLARLDFQELLRRLCIIMVEDAILMPEFPTLVWIMAAVSKGYCLDKKRVYWLFGLIAKIALVSIRDPLVTPNVSDDGKEGKEGSKEGREIKEVKEATTIATIVTTNTTVNAEAKTGPKLKQGMLNYKVPNQNSPSVVTSNVTPVSNDSVASSNSSSVVPSNTSNNSNASVAFPTKVKKAAKIENEKKVDRNWKKWKIYKLKDDDKSVIQSLLFRESYGGMKGDKNMLIDIASIWFNRFSTNNLNDLALKHYRNQEAEPTIYLSPPSENLNPTEWILAAIDYHVVNNVTMILADKYETLSYEDIKEAIWHHSSKYTNKISLSAIVASISTETSTAATTAAAKTTGTKGAGAAKSDKVDVDKDLVRTKKAWDLIRPEFYSLAGYFLKNNH